MIPILASFAVRLVPAFTEGISGRSNSPQCQVFGIAST